MRFLLVALFMVLATHVSAQEAQGMASEAPSQQEGKDGKANGTQTDASEPSIPVRVIESPEETQRTRDREAASDKHDADDLKAQQEAADAADRSATASEWQVVTAWWQVGVGIAGIIAILITIGFTIRATNAAVAASNAASEANKDARELFATEQRPWLIFDRPSVSADNSDGMLNIYFSVDVENIGKTPAMDAVLHLDMTFTELPVSSVVAVRRFGEKCCVPSTWENDHKLIFPGKSRPLYEIAGDAADSGKPFVRLLYCVSYRGNGIERVLATAGEVMFSARISDSSDKLVDPYIDIKRYSFYGTGFAA